MRQRLLFERIAEVVVAILLVATAGAVYRSFVFGEFIPIRVNVVGAELHSSNHAVKVTLPDFSTLRGQRAVLGLRLRNTRSEPRQIGLLRDGFPNNRVVLPPERTIRWDIVVSPETVRALAADVGDEARFLELTGDADGWALTALEIRNYHARLGDSPMAVVLPKEADTYTSGTGFLPVGIALSLLALMMVLGPKPQRRLLRLIGHGLAISAFLVCVTCLILPWISPYKVLLSQPAFSLAAAGLFSPVLLHSARRLVMSTRLILRTSVPKIVAVKGAISQRFATVNRYSTRHAVTFERGAALLALSAIGIAQPIFDVVSNSPEFFAARSTPPTTAVAAVLAICLGIPLALLAIERAVRALSQRAAATFQGMVLALLSAAVVMPWFRRGEVFLSPWDAVVSALVGLAVALAHSRARIVRQFLTALAPAALVVPALFLFDPNVSQTFLPSGSAAAAVQTIERIPPIVLVIFDELPLNSLLDADGKIDAERYPNFAALAGEAYWFRNASTVSSETVWAVPAIVSGRYPTTSHAVPTLRYYPVNLFTTLARHYDIFASVRFQELCPARACEYNSAIPPDTVWSLVSDLGVLWLHIVLPQPLTEELTPVVGDWAGFGRPRAARTGEIPEGRGGEFAQFLSSINGQPARLYVIHSLLPHMTFEYVPSGRRYRGPDYQTRIEEGKPLFERVSPAYADTLHQRHLAQVGYVDRLLGDLILRLREVEAYDKALVIITADHGASYRDGHARRAPQQKNLSEIIQVPLLIKLPGQRRGEIVDRIVETVDILPTILDVLAARVSLRLDGRSLIDGQVPERSFRTFIFRDQSNVESRALEDSPADRAASLDRKVRRFGSGNPMALYAPSGARHLLGMKVDLSAMRSASDVQITIRDRKQFAAVKRDRDPLPLFVRGVLSTTRREPVGIAVVVNGLVAAVSVSYQERGAHVFGTLIPETSLREGDNTVAAFVVDALPVKEHN